MNIGLHNLRPARGSTRNIKRIGRGNAGKGGTTGGRGTKGQKSRSGVSCLKRLGMKRIMLAMPKLGGLRRLHIKPRAVTLDEIAAAFPNGGEGTIATLKKHGAIWSQDGSAKIIGSGKVQKSFHVKGVKVSAGARAA